jgi:uncharacterized protein YdhG (YjbR/CyaY superfamily)
MAAKKTAKKSAKKSTSKIFSAEERAAMREHVQEMKARASRGAEADEEETVLAKIAAMPEPDRSLGKRLHAIIRAAAPSLSPRLWYGMPAYSKDEKVLCFFQPASKFKARYGTLGFNDKAALDDGHMWPIGYAVTELTAADETRIAALVKKAVG